MRLKTKEHLVLALFVIILSFLSISTMLHSSYTVNEPIYVMAGYYYLSEGQTFYTGHPIFTHILAAIPLQFIDVNAPNPSTIPHPFEFAREEFLFYENNDPDKIMFLARLPFLFLALIFGYFLFRWIRELYGLTPATLGLFLYTFNPETIWNASIVMTDLPVAGFMLISTYYFWKYLKENKHSSLIISGVFFGLAIASKSTGIFLLPIYVVLLLWFKKYSIKDLAKTFLLLGLLGVVIFSIINIMDIHPVYNAKNPFYTISSNFRSPERLSKIVGDVTSIKPIQNILIFTLTDLPVPGSSSIQAYASQFLHSINGHAQYFLGEYTNHGRWYYYFFLYLIKTPLALLILFALSLIFYRRLKKDGNDEAALLLSLGAFLFIFSFIVRLNLGLRHTLYILFLGIIFTSKIFQFRNFREKKKIMKCIVAVLLIWYLLTAILIFPSYTTYFNELIGGPINGPYYAVDEMDWGQDLINLKTYMDKNNITSIKLRYNGFEDPLYRKINYEQLNCTEEPGLIAISVATLYGRFWTEGNNTIDLNCFAWLRKQKPIDTIGYSIYIYNVTSNDLE